MNSAADAHSGDDTQNRAVGLTQDADTDAVVTVRADQLPMSCPVPDSPLWASHPRVYIPLEESGSAQCPYCGTRFVLADASQQD